MRERGTLQITCRGLVVGLAVALLPFSAAGHDRRVIDGDDGAAYVVAVWFRDEPAEPNRDNALVLAATKTGSGGAAPVAGLEAMLRAELRGDGERLPLTLAPQVEAGGLGPAAETGLYEAPFLLARPGDYRVRFVGEIEGVPIDEALFSHTVTSGWLDPPGASLSVDEDGRRERRREARRLTDANDAAPRSQSLVNVGIAVGTLAVLVALLALWRAGKRRTRHPVRATQPRSRPRSAHGDDA